MTKKLSCPHNQIVKLERKRYLICLKCGQMWNWFMSPEWTKSFIPEIPKVQKEWRLK